MARSSHHPLWPNLAANVSRKLSCFSVWSQPLAIEDSRAVLVVSIAKFRIDDVF